MVIPLAKIRFQGFYFYFSFVLCRGPFNRIFIDSGLQSTTDAIDDRQDYKNLSGVSRGLERSIPRIT